MLNQYRGQQLDKLMFWVCHSLDHANHPVDRGQPERQHFNPRAFITGGRLLRSNNFTSRVASRDFICREMADWVNPIASPAAAKVPKSAIATKVSSSFRLNLSLIVLWAGNTINSSEHLLKLRFNIFKGNL